MANIRNINDLILGFIDYIKQAQPDLDTKPGEVARDLFIDAPSTQIALLYDELSKISYQSIRLANGSDLDRIAANYGLTRKLPKKATGTALLTFKTIAAPIAINKNSIVYATNGFSFIVVSGTTIQPSSSNLYKSIATKYKNNLDYIGITDQYALEVVVEASSSGTSGNIGVYSLSKTSIPGVSNVTNILSTSGGTNQESDSSLRGRVLAVFNGSVIGTSVGYRNTAMTNSSVLDAIVVGPGDALMTRDGTETVKNSDGTYTIISDGTGGKVDVIILGTTTSEYTDSFIFKDKSNKSDPTDSSNNFILGQITADVGKTITKKRLDDITAGALPAQPVSSILSVSGTLSGTNFTEKTTDYLGRVSGNYELSKDAGAYANSAFGFDTFKWISNKIISYPEDKIKSTSNSQDNLTFTDVISISKIQQNIQIANENSKISSSDRSIVQLYHYPCSSVTRVFNTNTGERYNVVSQNLDGVGSTNLTGRIKISGNSLPSISDTLQVDYSWINDYDSFTDFDGKMYLDNPRLTLNKSTQLDSVDWGFSNLVRSEQILLTKDSYGNFFAGTSNHNIDSILAVNYYSEAMGSVIVNSTLTSPLYGKLIIVITGLLVEPTNVLSVKLINTNKEIYNTKSANGYIISSSYLSGSSILYSLTVVLPDDSIGASGSNVVVSYNYSDIFGSVNTGNFSGNLITIPVENYVTDKTQLKCELKYIATSTPIGLMSITDFPISRSCNSFQTLSNIGPQNFYNQNATKRETLTIQNDGNPYVTLNCLVSDYILLDSNIQSVFSITSEKEIISPYLRPSIDSSGTNYKLYFMGVDFSTLTNDLLIVTYKPLDLKRIQPITFDSEVLRVVTSTVQHNSTDGYYCSLYPAMSETTLKFKVIDKDGYVYASGVDGVISYALGATSFSSASVNFSLLQEITNKYVIVYNANPANNARLNISSLISTSVVHISYDITNLDLNQFCVIRQIDTQELVTLSVDGSTYPAIMKLKDSNNILVGQVCNVYYLNNNQLKTAPTKLSVNVSDQVNVSGSFNIYGKTLTKVSSAIVSATSSSLKISISEALKLALTATTIPINIKLARVVSVEKVSVTTGNEVLGVLNTFDVFGYKIKDNKFFQNESFINSSLSDYDFILPSTTTNVNNTPSIGDKLRITFYYLADGDSENLQFTKNGTLYTSKSFGSIDKVSINSGFNKSKSTKVLISTMNQPANGNRYRAFYDYTAPKANERITIKYDYNKLISDVTLNIENQRPINADVLVKQATIRYVDVVINIVITSDAALSGSSQIVAENTKNKIINVINSVQLNTILDASDLVNTAYSVTGVDRARIIQFNDKGNVGQVLSLTAQKNEYFQANSVVVNIETR